MLGLESDPKGAGYNVNQSLIAIGFWRNSRKRFLRRGRRPNTTLFLNKAPTLYFVQLEREWGFLGTFVIIVLFVTLLLRIM